MGRVDPARALAALAVAAVMAAAAAAWTPGALGRAALHATASTAATHYTTPSTGTASTPATTTVETTASTTTPPATTTRLTCTTTYTTPSPTATLTSCTTTVTVPEPPAGPSIVAAVVDARTGEFYARGELNICSSGFCAARVAFDVYPGPAGSLHYEIVVLAYRDGVTVKEVPLNLTLAGPAGSLTLISEGGGPVKLSAGQTWRTAGTVALPWDFDATRYTTVKASARAWVSGAEYRAHAEGPLKLAPTTVVVVVELASKPGVSVSLPAGFNVMTLEGGGYHALLTLDGNLSLAFEAASLDEALANAKVVGGLVSWAALKGVASGLGPEDAAAVASAAIQGVEEAWKSTASPPLGVLVYWDGAKWTWTLLASPPPITTPTPPTTPTPTYTATAISPSQTSTIQATSVTTSLTTGWAGTTATGRFTGGVTWGHYGPGGPGQAAPPSESPTPSPPKAPGASTTTALVAGALAGLIAAAAALAVLRR